MNPTAQNPLNPPLFEIPNPPDEFGQDGGKFYRCYDALADEIDEDMTKGLKEQLDGMLIFAGLFAGVNSAFLALTLPMLSADPADDTNALLAQNNAILLQVLMGKVDALPTPPPLPSATFSPSRDVYTINALFALSLALAITTSFLAVLGRQWLVYYRKRSGGGPDRQRWMQLKRFLGAGRWRLEPILDDVLPSLLQIGLIIFCISLILYLRYLRPSISVIVGIPLYAGLVFFVGSALCTVWDRFCPFHSPLSHLLPQVPRPLFWVFRVVRKSFASRLASLHDRRMVRTAPASWPQRRPSRLNSKWLRSMAKFFRDRPMERTWDRVRQLPRQAWQLTSSGFHFLRHGRQEESIELLQTVALQRAICTSDDPVTLLHSTANILAITSPVTMERLWAEVAFRQRFMELLRNSYSAILWLGDHGVDPRDFTESARRLYHSAAGHIILTLEGSPQSACDDILRSISTFRAASITIPPPRLQDSSLRVIKGNLGACVINWAFRRGLERKDRNDGRDYLIACSELLPACSDLSFLSFFSWTTIWLLSLKVVYPDSLETMRRSFKGDWEYATESLENAFAILLKAESAAELDCDRVLTNILLGVQQIVANDQNRSDEILPHYFELLKICEAALRNPRLPTAARYAGRKLRIDVALVWQRGYSGHNRQIMESGEGFLAPLQSYLRYVTTFDRSELDDHENMDVVQAFGGPILHQLRTPLSGWRYRDRMQGLCNTFNALVSDVCRNSGQMQNKSKRVRNPDEQWCHWQEKPLSIKQHTNTTGMLSTQITLFLPVQPLA